MKILACFRGQGVDAGSDTVQTGNAMMLNRVSFPAVTQCLLIGICQITTPLSQETDL